MDNKRILAALYIRLEEEEPKSATEEEKYLQLFYDYRGQSINKMIKKILYNDKCRTCLGQTKGMQSLDKLANIETPLSFAELLKEVVNVNVIYDKSSDMPQHICIYCSRKLKASHAFIKQAQEVNEKLWSLLNPTSTSDQQLNCLEESEIDIEKCLEIKMESSEDDGREEGKIVIELPSEEYNLQLKTEKQEENSLSEDVIGRNSLEASNKSRGNSMRLEELDAPIKAMDNYKGCATDGVKYANEGSEVNKQHNSSDETDKFNGSDISIKETDNTHSDSDDEKCLSSIKADILTRHNGTKGFSKETGTINIHRKRKRKTQNKISQKNEDEDIPVPCQKCNKIFNNSKELSSHLRNAHVPDDQKCACLVCGATFTRTCNMYTHMRTFHETEYLQILCPSKERVHECEKCHRKYASKKNLKYHIKLKHNKEDQTDDDTLPEAKIESSLKKREVRPLCSICGASVCNKAQLVIHMRRHTGEKPFKCELCDRGFLQITDLNSHRRIHTGEKPYKCKICEKAFRVSTKLANHMRSHTDERPYKCSQCERSFKYSKDLNIHNRIHTGERPYSCNVCGNTFTQSNSLKTHRMKLGHMDNSL